MFEILDLGNGKLFYAGSIGKTGSLKIPVFVGFGDSKTCTEVYRFSFNGQEKDKESLGEGNSNDFGERIYDSRLCRFMSIDPLTKDYPELSVYQFAGNMPIWAIDLDGLEPAFKLPDGTYTTARDGQLSNHRISPDAIKYYKTITPPAEDRANSDLDPQNFFPLFGDANDFNQGVLDWNNGNKAES